ncbi:MAG: four helix bundle protein [Acidobacteria bacterium]|nr:MAG: four helix bundle protein [Acidobacteriota bacterium]
MAVLQDLIVYRLAEELRAGVIWLTELPSARREFRLRDQLRSAAGSVVSNIAEGYGRQRHADFVKFIDYAAGSLRETESWLRDGGVRGLWSEDELAPALRLCRRLTPALQNLRRYLKATKTPS